MNPSLDRLTQALGYDFSAPDLLRSALTHRSFGSKHNERLEFLGDAVLSFIVSSELYARFPSLDEGRLSRLRASLVKGDTLADLARSLDLGDYLQLGSGELKSGGFRRASILADAMEAVIGAVYLDGGIDAARRVVLALYGDNLDNVSSGAGSLKDPKTRLQEHLQSRRLPLPHYEVVSVTGEAHDQTFVVRCFVHSLPEPTEGVGASRRRAEQAAAEAALNQLVS
ncbi:MAG: ribonuclease III [Thiohalomonadaceae bacterium]